MLSPEERHISVGMPIILIPGADTGCCSEQAVETATIEPANTLEDERIRTVTEDSLSDATLARSPSIETSRAAEGMKAQLARPSHTGAPLLDSEPPHADLIGVYCLG